MQTMNRRSLYSLAFIAMTGVALGAPPTTTELSVSQTALRFGQTLTLTVIVSPATSGTITFYDGVNVIAIEPVSGGTAVAKTSALAAGPHTVFARYQASSQYAASVSSKISVTVTTLPATAFDPLPPFGPNTLEHVLVADINNDQIPDLIVVSSSFPSTSTLWLGNGDGTFRPSPQPSLNAGVVLIADFNNDGKPDLLADTYLGGVPIPQVFFGAGDGTFTAFATLPPESANSAFFAVGDFNGDGNLDLIGGDSILFSWLGNGDGTFQSPIPVNGIFYASSVFVADFNSDGIPDLLVSGDTGAYLQLGKGDGTFTPAPRGTLPGAGNAVLADFNNDGKLDVAIASSEGSNLTYIYLGNGDGTFQSVQSGVVTTGTYQFATDVNGDGKIDLLSTTQIGYGNGDGTFQSPVTYSNTGSNIAAVASLDGKGEIDLVGADSQIYIALGSNLSATTLIAAPSPATLSSPLTLTASVTPSSATGAVTFYDGTTQLGSANVSGGQAVLTLNAPYAGSRVLSAHYAGDDATQASISQPVALTVNGPASSTTVTASNPSVVFGQPVTFTAQVTPPTSGKVTFLDGGSVLGSATLQSGAAAFTTSSLLGGAHAITAQYDGGSYAPSISAIFNLTVTTTGGSGLLTQGTPLALSAATLYSADFNGDGSPDLLALSPTQVTVLLASGPGTFTNAATYPISGSYYDTALLGDINQDGNTDFVLESGNGATFTATVYLGHGDGTFSTGATFSGNITQVLLADVNRDGILDLVTATSATVNVLLGNGDGSFQAPVLVNWNPTGAGVTITSIGLVDANHDGAPDLLVASAAVYQAASSNVSLLLNNGSGFFGAPQPLFTLPFVTGISTADFNHDGFPDLSIVASGSLYCFLGNGNNGFTQSFTYSAGGGSQLIADVNGDGNLDVIVGVALFLGNGNGTFQPPIFQSGLSNGAIGDFFKTGRTTIALPNNTNTSVTFYSFAALTPITLSVSPNPAALGATVTLTATVTPASATGTVAFYDGFQMLGSSALSSGVAIFTTSSLLANQHYLSAYYEGDANNPASFSPYQPVTITGTATSLALTSTASQSNFGHPVVFTASISPSSTTGIVRLYNGTQLVTSASLNQGSAVFTVASLPAGLLKVHAVYQGLSPYAIATSNTVSETVSSVPASAFVTADQAPPYETTFYASGDFNGDGIIDFIGTISNSNGLELFLGQPNGTFQTVNTNVESFYAENGQVVVVDLNGDGLSDLILPFFGQILINQGNGQFTFAGYFSSSMGCAPADLNGDGMPDLICLASDLTLLPQINSGNAFIQLPSTIQPPTGNGVPPSIITADFNGDGKADFAVSNYGINSIGVFLGNGDGTFQAPVIINAGTTIGQLATIDVNQDGKPDLVVLASGGNNVLTLLGNGDGTFGRPASFSGVPQATSLAATDFNGDGQQDVFVQSATQLAVLLGNGNGTLQAPSTFPQTTPYLAPFDFNGHGRVDLPFLLGAINDSVGVTPSAGAITAGQTITLTAAVSPSSLAGTVTFFDGGVVLGTSPIINGTATLTVALPADGGQDISAQVNGPSGYITSVARVLDVGVTAPSGGSFSAAVNYPVGHKPSAIVSADFNHDGKLDLAIANSSDNTVTILWGNGQGGFGTPLTLPVGANPTLLAVADFNGDGIPDIAVGNAGSNSISIFLSGNGTLTAGTSIALAFSPLGLAATDLNGDGFVDLLATGAYYQYSTPLLGTGTGIFTTAPAGFSTFNSGPALAGDFNGDGIPDIFTGQQVNLNLGQGLFSSFYVLGNVGIVSAAADFNNDGKTDIVAIATTASGALAGISQGNGSFSEAIYPLSQAPVAFAAGDFNGDGYADLAVAHSNATVGLMLNHGDGTFSPESTFPAGSDPVALAVGDFNGDGRLDLAVANSTGNNVSIFLGAAPPACTFTVSPSSFSFSFGGGNATVNITASPSNCSWSANYVEPGQTASPPNLTANGSGSGSFTWQIPANFSSYYSPAPETAYIYVAGLTIPVHLAQTAQTFPDVPPSSNYFDAVNLLYQNGITNGCGVNSQGQPVFCPTESVTRDQMAVFFIRAILHSPNVTPSAAAPYFADVPSDYWAFNFIQRLYELGVTKGCGTNAQGQLLYCPGDVVTRDQMAVFLIRARYGATIVDFPETPYFTDVPANYWAFPSIQRLRLDNITEGCETTLYCPTDPVIRGDMAIFLMRALLNQLLPATEPILTGIVQDVTPGTTNISLAFNGLNTNFVQGTTQIVFPPNSGITLNSLTVIEPTTFSINIDVAAGTPPGPLPVYVITGSEEAVLPNGLVIQ
jgi:hypothetical protein